MLNYELLREDSDEREVRLMSTQNRIYAILEIQKRHLIFSAFKVSHQHHLLLYKEQIKAKTS